MLTAQRLKTKPPNGSPSGPCHFNNAEIALANPPMPAPTTVNTGLSLSMTRT